MATQPTISPELLRRSSSSVIEATEQVLRAGQAPGKAAFIARAMRAVANLADDLSERDLADAAGATTDANVLLKALSNPAAIAPARDEADDPLRAARLRGVQARQEILQAEGGTLTAAEVASLLGISRQAVDKRRRANRLIGLQTAKRGYLYPAWQFSGAGQTLAGLDDALDALAEFSPLMQVGYLLSPNLRLEGRRPLDALRAEDVGIVVAAARAYGEHGAA
jgi:biotin operon repressor